MLNKLLAAIRRYDMLPPNTRVICAVSGGADSMALLWGMWLLKDKLNIQVSAAHFNHHLRGEESIRDENFVRQFCDFHEIPLFVGEAQVTAGEKGLEAAAREARYGFLKSLNGLIATAHTADDNAETLMMHLIRGTGLRGLGGITPKTPHLIRPMLDITRKEVETFLEENFIDHIEDSSNGSDEFLRNRIRHQMMPLLRQENPNIAKNLSAMSQRLRQEDAVIQSLADGTDCHNAATLQSLAPALRRRALERLLKESGIPEPNASHIAQAEALVQTEKPSAFAEFPGGVILRRNYEKLEAGSTPSMLNPVFIEENTSVTIEQAEVTVSCRTASEKFFKTECFTVCPEGKIIIRSRQAGDTIRLSGGTKSLKKLFSDRKIPALRRMLIPVIADDRGILGVYGLGANLDRLEGNHPVTFEFQKANI